MIHYFYYFIDSSGLYYGVFTNDLELPEGTKQSALYKIANVNGSSFSSMYNEVINQSSGEPLNQAIQSKADFVWYGTEVKAGDWFRGTKE